MTEEYIDPDWIALQMHEANKLRLERIKELLAKRGIGVNDHVHSSLTTIDLLITFPPGSTWPMRFEDDDRMSRSMALLMRSLPNVCGIYLHHTNMKKGTIMLLPEHEVLYWSIRIGWEHNTMYQGMKDPLPVIGGNNPRYDRPRYLDATSKTGLIKYPVGKVASHSSF
jgi:hypothetical protein